MGIGQGEMAVADVSRGRQRLLFAMENGMLNPTAGWGDKLHVSHVGILHKKRPLHTRYRGDMLARSLYHFFLMIVFVSVTSIINRGDPLNNLLILHTLALRRFRLCR